MWMDLYQIQITVVWHHLELSTNDESVSEAWTQACPIVPLFVCSIHKVNPNSLSCTVHLIYACLARKLCNKRKAFCSLIKEANVEKKDTFKFLWSWIRGFCLGLLQIKWHLLRSASCKKMPLAQLNELIKIHGEHCNLHLQITGWC